MLKRIFLFVFVLSVLALIAALPMNVNAAPENAPKLQVTLVPVTPVVTIGVATAPPSSTVPVTGGIPMSMIVIVGLLVVLAIAVVIGGMAMMNNRNQ